MQKRVLVVALIQALVDLVQALVDLVQALVAIVQAHFDQVQAHVDQVQALVALVQTYSPQGWLQGTVLLHGGEDEAGENIIPFFAPVGSSGEIEPTPWLPGVGIPLPGSFLLLWSLL